MVFFIQFGRACFLSLLPIRHRCKNHHNGSAVIDQEKNKGSEH